MASIIDNGTTTMPTREKLRRQDTNNLPDQSSRQDDVSTPAPTQTAAQVRKDEKGDVTKKDLFAAAEEADGGTVTKQLATEKRKERAKEVGQAVARMIASHGSVRMATALQLLRRELARCHDVLLPFASEVDFLSIIVLAETLLGTKDWKEISRDELDAIKRAADLGQREECMTFDHYNQVFRGMAARGWLKGPEINFDQVEPKPADEPS
jgi:hypothetical protein